MPKLMCARCRRKPAEKDRKQCAECLEYNREYHRRFYESRKKSDKCVVCGAKGNKKKGAASCRSCVADMTRRVQNTRAERKAAGLCQLCGHARSIAGTHYCLTCKMVKAAEYEQFKRAGKCPLCHGRRKIARGLASCRKCLELRRERKAAA